MSEDVQLSKICMDFGSFRAVNNVDVTIKPGEFFSFLGPSGCGKTTILRLISGFMEPTEGSVKIGGKDMKGIRPNARPTALIFQNLALFPLMPVWENITFGLEVRGVPKAQRRAKAEELLQLVDLHDSADKRISQLSGGQKQRVAIARALAVEPKVMLLDEPLSALDLKLRKEMQHELKRLQLETGITFIFVTHDQEEALTMSDRVAVMRDGRILQVGNPRDIYTRPVDRFVADFIGETNFLSATIDGKKVRLATGDTVAASGVEAHSEGAAVTLAIRPEQVRVDDKGGLAATVAETVYFGTDTHLHLTLGDGSELVARLQSPPSGEIGLSPGAKVSVSFTEGAVQVLEH
jgi:spermidine/putrescine transport system ATP-binding protein